MVSNQCEYLWQKRGVYYFRCKVPNDVQQHYERSQIVICLKTKSKSAAIKASRSIASKLDVFWLQMRISDMDVPAANLLVRGKPKDAFTSYASSLSDALATYCSLKGADRTALFFTAAKRNVGYVLEHLGDRPIDTYRSADAASFRDWLIKLGLTTSSISRIFGTIRAVINLTIQEHGLDCPNAFANIYLPKKAEEKRKPIPKHEIIQIQKTCLKLADERRLVIALISDTGMRLSEALGLVWGDVRLDHEYPHINLVEHPWRQLKTSGSKRLVPLVGASLEAVKVMHQQGFGIFLVVVIETAQVTPPIGFNLFVLQGMTRHEIGYIARTAIPMVGLMLLMVVILVVFPELATWLPENIRQRPSG